MFLIRMIITTVFALFISSAYGSELIEIGNEFNEYACKKHWVLGRRPMILFIIFLLNMYQRSQTIPSEMVSFLIIIHIIALMIISLVRVYYAAEKKTPWSFVVQMKQVKVEVIATAVAVATGAIVVNDHVGKEDGYSNRLFQEVGSMFNEDGLKCSDNAVLKRYRLESVTNPKFAEIAHRFIIRKDWFFGIIHTGGHLSLEDLRNYWALEDARIAEQKNLQRIADNIRKTSYIASLIKLEETDPN